MISAQIKLDISGMQISSSDLAKFNKEFESKLYKNIMNRYDKNIDENGKKWQSLAPATIKAKGSNKILYTTGRLKKSIKVRSSAQMVEAYTELGYAIVHNNGSVGRANIPKRSFLNTSKSDVEQYAKELMQKFFKK